MYISEETLKLMAAAIRAAITAAVDDIDLATIALETFAENASLDDFDELQEAVMEGR